MKISNLGLAFLKQHESIRGYNNQTGQFMTYDDGYGFMTIGYGHKIMPEEDFADGLSTDGVDALLYCDLVIAENAVNAAINISLSQNQFDALVSLAYNIGGDAFKKSTVAKYINTPGFRGRVYPTLESAWMAWNKSDGRVSRGLKNRRAAEWDLFQK